MLLLKSFASERSVDSATVWPASYLRQTSRPLLSLRIRVCHPNTRIYVRLLGPCFKTGRLKPFRQHPKRWCDTKPSFFAVSIIFKKSIPLWPKATSSPKNAAVLSPTQSMTNDYNSPRGYLSLAFYSKSNWCWLAKAILVSSVSLLTISRTV